MGELIQVYNTVELNGKEYKIELNGPINRKTGGIIHIQSSDTRIEMTQMDFYKMVGCINLAVENLKRIKKQGNI